MKLETKREMIYGNLGRGKRYMYFAYLNGERIASGETAESAKSTAMANLFDAWKYAGNPILRIASDGSVRVFQQTSELEYRCDAFDGAGQSMGSSMGPMRIDGVQTYSLTKYADYLAAAYETAIAPRPSAA